MLVTVVHAASICQQGAKARERIDQTGGGGGEGVEAGFSPLPRKGDFLKICMKTAYPCTLNAIIGG